MAPLPEVPVPYRVVSLHETLAILGRCSVVLGAEMAQGSAERLDRRPRPSSPSQSSLRHRLSSGGPIPPKDSAAALLISGAVAGGVSKLLTAPIDRVKIMYQVRGCGLVDGDRLAVPSFL